MKLNWYLINLLKVRRLFCIDLYQFNELKFTSAVSLRNSASWRWLKIVVKWRHWSTCTRKGWRRTDACPVWWVYAISISSVTRQVWRSGLQRREVQKQIWQTVKRRKVTFWLRVAKLILCSSRYLDLYYVFETVFRFRHHYTMKIAKFSSWFPNFFKERSGVTNRPWKHTNGHECINPDVQYSPCIKCSILSVVIVTETFSYLKPV